MYKCCLLNKKDSISHDWNWNYTLTGEPTLFANRGFTSSILTTNNQQLTTDN
jgi:hypothetical protein